MGRRAIQETAMSNAERQRRYRQMQKSKGMSQKEVNGDNVIIDQKVDNNKQDINKNITELVDYCVALEEDLENIEKIHNNFVNRINHLLSESAKPYSFRIEIENNDIVFKRATRNFSDDGKLLGSPYLETFYFKELVDDKFICHKKDL